VRATRATRATLKKSGPKECVAVQAALGMIDCLRAYSVKSSKMDEKPMTTSEAAGSCHSFAPFGIGPRSTGYPMLLRPSHAFDATPSKSAVVD